MFQARLKPSAHARWLGEILHSCMDGHHGGKQAEIQTQHGAHGACQACGLPCCCMRTHLTRLGWSLRVIGAASTSQPRHGVVARSAVLACHAHAALAAAHVHLELTGPDAPESSLLGP